MLQRTCLLTCQLETDQVSLNNCSNKGLSEILIGLLESLLEMKKLFILLLLSSLVGCGEETEKDQKASALYDRICGAIRSSTTYHRPGFICTNTSFTAEWEAMKNKIIEDKDTIFLITSTDFQILIRKTTPLGAIVIDTTKTATSDSSKNGSWK